MEREITKKAFVKSLPVMAGYLVLGIGFGIMMKANGFGIIYSVAMSALIYAGSMQYVGVSLIATGASLLSIGLTTLMVNARHLFYGVTMIDRYKGAGIKKLYLMHALTDETFSLVCTEEESENKDYYFLVSLFNHLYWIAGTAAGAIIGTVIAFETAGIDFAMTALFVTVFVEQWLSTKEHRPALIGLGASVICLLVFGPDNFLIPSMILITVLITAIRGRLEGGSKDE